MQVIFNPIGKEVCNPGGRVSLNKYYFGKFHGQKSLAGAVSRVYKESDMTGDWRHVEAHTHTQRTRNFKLIISQTKLLFPCASVLHA